MINVETKEVFTGNYKTNSNRKTTGDTIRNNQTKGKLKVGKETIREHNVAY